MSLIDTYLEEIDREIALREREEQLEAQVCDPYTWAHRYRRIDGQPFTLERHKPLIPIYQDNSPHIVVMKCAQVGVSELAITRALHALDMGARYYQTGLDGLNVAYLFPTLEALRDFSKERASGVVEEHEHIADMFRGGFNDQGFKQVGRSYFYLRGTWIREDGKSPGLKSYKADLLIRDEYDEMDPRAISMSEKRIRASIVKRILDISTPTLPGIGIHLAYLQSDQHVWHIPCPHCSREQALDFFRDVRGNGQPYEVWYRWDRNRILLARWSVHCEACKGEIDRLADGRYIAQQPESDIRGYHIPALCFPMVELQQLALGAIKTDPSEIEEFYRSDLGVPFIRSGTAIQPTMLDAVATDALPVGRWTRNTMGIDVGSRFHYRISGIGSDGERYIRAAGSVNSFEALDPLMRQYQISCAVIDAQPELNGAKKWIAGWKGRAWRAFYPNGMAADLFRKKADDEGDSVVQINRTMAMDQVYAEVAGGTVQWPTTLAKDEEVRAHLSAPNRVTTKDKHGQPVTHWVHTAPDHLFHASVYEMIARQLLPKVPTGVRISPGRGAKTKMAR